MVSTVYFAILSLNIFSGTNYPLEFPPYVKSYRSSHHDQLTSEIVLMFAWKIGPALATGNTIILKTSEFTPLSALRMCQLVQEAGFPPGVLNVVTGYGNIVGNAITTHMKIHKVAFTGSTLVGRKVMEAAAKSNLKTITLELGGKSPNIIFDDADIDQALNWASFGLL